MNGVLPEWVQRLLGIQTGPGEGTSWSLTHAWPWPPWATLLLAVFVVVWVVSIYWREGEASRRRKLTLALLRLAAVALVLLMIAQLALSLQRTGLPYVAVLLDNSQSMAHVDRYDGPAGAALTARAAAAGFPDASRWNLARTVLAEHNAALLRAVAERYKLRTYYLSTPGGARASTAEGATPLVAELRAARPDLPVTPLGEALRSILGDLRGTLPAAVVLLSDGVNTAGPPLADGAAELRRRGVPLFAVGLGDDRPLRQLKLDDLLLDDVVFVHDVVDVEAKLTAQGLRGEKIDVLLQEAGRSEPLARTELAAGGDQQAQSVHLAYRPARPGRFRLIVEASLSGQRAQGETPAVAPARLEQEIDVRDEKIRVLLVDDYPRYEFRYLRNLLAREPSIQLHTLLEDADVDHVQQDPTALRVFPVRQEELAAYDVIVLGDADPGLLGQSVLQNLADFVGQKQKGGALLVVAGPRFMPLAYRGTPLEPLLPVDLTAARLPGPDEPSERGFTVEPTPLGLAMPPLQLGQTPLETAGIWKALPPLYWLLEAPDVRPGTRVLAQCSGHTGLDGRPLPVIAMQYVGAGRVWMQLTDETWRWRRRAGDLYFGRYWIQTIRYLARGKLRRGGAGAQLTVEQRQLPLGEPVRLRVSFADSRLAPAEDNGVTVVLEHPGQSSQRVKLGRMAGNRGVFETTLAGLPPGDFHAWMAAPTLEGRPPAVDFRVVAPPGENQSAAMDAAELHRAAESTGGHFYTVDTADQLLTDLPEGRQVPIESLPPKPLWNRWPVLAAVLLLLSVEWLVRKRSGMV